MGTCCNHHRPLRCMGREPRVAPAAVTLLVLLTLLPLQACFTATVWDRAPDGRRSKLSIPEKVALTPFALALDGATWWLQLCIEAIEQGRQPAGSCHR